MTFNDLFFYIQDYFVEDVQDLAEAGCKVATELLHLKKKKKLN